MYSLQFYATDDIQHFWSIWDEQRLSLFNDSSTRASFVAIDISVIRHMKRSVAIPPPHQIDHAENLDHQGPHGDEEIIGDEECDNLVCGLVGLDGVSCVFAQK